VGGLPTALIVFMSWILLNAPGKPLHIAAKIKPEKEKGGNRAGHFLFLPVCLKFTV